MNKIKVLAIVFSFVLSLSACKSLPLESVLSGDNLNSKQEINQNSDMTNSLADLPDEESTENAQVETSFAWNAITDGDTLESRINTPLGYERSKVEEGSFGAFVRNYEMKADGSEVLLYNGHAKWGQGYHVAVFKLPIEDRDLQQCADSIMRFYGEYWYSRGEYDKIKFPMGGGFVGDFAKWSKGYGIGLKNEKLYWKKKAENDASYDSFVKFMRIVFTYSGTMHMEDASHRIELKDARIGDIFIKGGSPGHVVMIADVCEDEQGHKAFLLAQGYMPAQEFHVIKNPAHEDDPWYYEDEIVYPLETAEYTFPKECLKRLVD